MIQIYAPNNKNYEMNGDAVLVPSICENAAELGGSWSLDMTHPIDDEGRWKNIVEEAVISAPTFMGEKQLFRINEVDKQDTEITVKAYPIFLDSKDEVFLMDKRPTVKTGQEALNILTEGTKYSGESDIAAGNTAYFIRRNLMDCLNGEYPSYATVWGGEPLYDNFKVIINERAGGDYGAEVRYGKNMEGISFKEDLSSVVTRIVPVAYNGRTLSTEYVDSPLIEKYAKIYTKAIKFEDVKWHEDLMESEDTENLIVCYSQEELDAALIAKCNEQFEAGIDLYSVTINVDLVSLENTEEYKDFKDLVRIGLGDDVSCYNNRLGITTKARAIKIVWDCIQNTAKEVVLGDYQTNFLAAWGSVLDKIASSMNQDGTLMAERVAGILNGINTQIKVQSTAAQKVESRVLLFEDLDPNSALYGALAIGTQGVQIANKRTADDRAWDWSTAMTANGIVADAIITGLLTDKTGKNYWNLDTGEVNFTGTFSQETPAGLQSVKIEKHQVKFYAWHDDGNYAGAIGAVRVGENNDDGLEMWCDKGGHLYLGYATEVEGDNAKKIKPVIMIDESCEDSTPWIKNTSNGTIFPNNPLGGIEVQNGLIKKWGMFSVADSTLSAIVGLSWDSGGITEVTFADIKVKDGLISEWKLRKETF